MNLKPVFSFFIILLVLAGRTSIAADPSMMKLDLSDRLVTLRELIANGAPAKDRQRILGARINIIDSHDPTKVYASLEAGRDQITVSLGFASLLYGIVEAIQTLPDSAAISYLKYKVSLMKENTRRVQNGQPLLQEKDALEWAGWSLARRSQLDADDAKQAEIQKVFTASLAFVLAHELGHHLLGHGLRPPLDLTDSRAREAAADNWACDALVRVNVGPIAGVYGFLFYLALDDDALKHEGRRTHPAEVRRIDAIVDATIAGLDRLTIQSDRFNKADVEAMLRDVANKLKRAIQGGNGGIDAPLNSQVSTAPAFPNDPNAAESIIQDEDPDYKWNTTASNPTVVYAVPYKNEGQRTIECVLSVAVGTVLRQGSASQKRASWRETSRQEHHIILKPGESTTLRGVLRWQATDEVNPRMHSPDPSLEENSELYRCRFWTR